MFESEEIKSTFIVNKFDNVFVIPEIGIAKKVKAAWLPKKKKNIWKYDQQLAFILPYLESRKTQTNLPAAQDYVSEEYEVEENATYELEQGLNFQESQRIDDEVVLAEPGTAEQSLDAVKVLRNKKQKRFTNTLSQQMLEKLPKYEQAQIKLALSNSVLSAEIRFAQHSSERCLPNQMQTHSDYFASPSSIDSVQPITLPSDYSSLDNEYSTNRPTLLEMTSVSNI
ncbi:hypothetical protein FQA39_LY10382 [Lamprigera yunnana]|nr:hypothetical protein FQA39_LY10382 [Lamprigera yunnana]